MKVVFGVSFFSGPAPLPVRAKLYRYVLPLSNLPLRPEDTAVCLDAFHIETPREESSNFEMEATVVAQRPIADPIFQFEPCWR